MSDFGSLSLIFCVLDALRCLNYSLYFIFIYLPLFINLLNFPLLASLSIPLSLSKDLIESKTQDVEREREIISFASLLNLSLHRRIFFFFFFSAPHRFAIRFRIKRTFPYVLSLSVRFDLIRSMCLRDSRDELVLITIRVEAIDLLKICGSWLHFECQSSRIDRF